MRTDQILPALLRSDPAAPRVTYYDDTDGPQAGERIELSGKVLANWVAKAGNLLIEEFDLTAGDRVELDLPAEHWRTLYWALATWAVGGVVVDEDGDVLITDRPRPDVADQVAVTLAALARRGTDVPVGILDEAAELSGYGDHLDAEAAAADDPAVHLGSVRLSSAQLAQPRPGGPARVQAHGDLATVLTTAAAVWAGDGSVLLCRGTTGDLLAARLSTEGAERVEPT